MPLHLFQAYGIELEYMLVDRDTLEIKSIADELLKDVLGNFGSDFENGVVTWSNELVLHVVELKSTNPESDLYLLGKQFAENVTRINLILSKWNVMLLPTAAHPFMNPITQTKLWPHDNKDVYEIYDRIFDCRGHGWANVQSTHLNLPFSNDEEFAKLHAAIRLVLPILPALCSSSPVLDGKTTGMLATRLKYYKNNQSKIPSITGKVIPEALFSESDYNDAVYKKIQSDIVAFDHDQILDPVWVNSRGAIPRFDRGSIEIRIMDIQECPSADLALVTLVIETLKVLVERRWITFEEQKKWETEVLVKIYDQTTIVAQDAVLNDGAYLEIFGYTGSVARAGDLWRHIYERLKLNSEHLQRWNNEIEVVLEKGTLAQRIVQALGTEPPHNTIIKVYKELSRCLAENRMFRGKF